MRQDAAMTSALPLEHCQPDDEPSSRTSAEWAGWTKVDGHWTWVVDEERGEWEHILAELKDRRWRFFNWLTARALLDSVNDQIVRKIGDLVDPRRQRWVAAQRVAGQDAN